MTAVAIRRLTPDDAVAYRALRQRALREHPAAFTSSASEEDERPLAWSEDRLRASIDKPHDAFFGAWADALLVGMVGLQGRYRAKERHNATVVGMFVAPEWEGRGTGSALLRQLLAFARTCPVLTQLDLTVTAGHERPASLYVRHGFGLVGTLPRAIRVDGEWHDKQILALQLH